MLEHFLPIFDKVKIASFASAVAAGIAGALIGAVPDLEAVRTELNVLIDFFVSGGVIGAVTFAAGWITKERAVKVLPKE